MKTKTILITLIATLALAGVASASTARRRTTSQAVWRVFTPRASWEMHNSTGGLTKFTLHHMTHWGCWTGNIIDLVDTKQTASDYWAPGSDVIGHQILLQDPDGSWRLVGTYTQGPQATDDWTMQIHGYGGKPTPYIITPGRTVNSDTRTEYYTEFIRKITSACVRVALPAWAQHVYWRSAFTFTRSGQLHAHYEENQGCGPVACQIENWTFTRGQVGINSIADLRSGGNPLALVLNRRARHPQTGAQLTISR